MGRFFNSLVLTLGLYGCSDGIDIAHPIDTTVADIVSNPRKYEGKAVKFRDYGPFFVTENGLRGFFDADRSEKTEDDRLYSQTKCNDWSKLHEAARIMREAIVNRDVAQEVEIQGIVRSGDLEISSVRGEGGFVYIPLKGVKAVMDR